MKKILLFACIFSNLLFSQGDIGVPTGDEQQDLENYQWSQIGFSTDFTRMAVHPSEIISGGPGKDGIPSIDNPQFISIEQAEQWLHGQEPVILVQNSGDAKIYPLQILLWHEIINDRLGDWDLAVTYCPLCNTGVVFDSKSLGVEMDFGTTGRLRNSNLIMYDRQSETWWQQATGRGIIGAYADRYLSVIPSLTISFEQASYIAPHAQVVDRQTGHIRPYGENPYVGYDTPGRDPFLYRGQIDDTHDPMDRVLLIPQEEEDIILLFEEVKREKVVNIHSHPYPMVAFWVDDVISILDEKYISNSRDVGSVTLFYRNIDGQILEFKEAGSGLYFDDISGSLWNNLGIAQQGIYSGTALAPAEGIPHFWFSGKAFRN